MNHDSQRTAQRQIPGVASPPTGRAHDNNPPFGNPLTPREALVMTLIEQGLSTRLAAKRLNVRPRTVDKHIERVLRKLGARSRIEAVAMLRADRDTPLMTDTSQPGSAAGPGE